MADSSQRRTSYLRAAFWNVYNIASLAGVAVAGAASHQLWLVAAGGAAEAAWMLLAPANRRFRRALDARQSSHDRLEHLRQMQEQAALLPSEDRQRVQSVGAYAAEVKAECQRNSKLQGDFVGSQLERLDGLVAEYIHLALTANRCESYLNRSDTRQISRDQASWRRSIETATDDQARELARQNVAILEKRLTLVEEMSRFVGRARGNMALIQNTIALLRDEVMTVATPETLTVQLDDLVASVDAIREATREIESVVAHPPATLLEAAPPPAAESPRSESETGNRIRT